jgi:hypothetical protein
LKDSLPRVVTELGNVIEVKFAQALKHELPIAVQLVPTITLTKLFGLIYELEVRITSLDVVVEEFRYVKVVLIGGGGGGGGIT